MTSFPVFTAAPVFSAALTCFTCIRSGFQYCDQGGMYLHSASAPTAFGCCDPAALPYTAANCAAGYNATPDKLFAATCTDDYQNKEFALAACP